MNTNARTDETVGVVVARFQTPTLHDGHRYLLDYVKRYHEKLCVVLGYSDIVPTARNPLDLATRKKMLHGAYPAAHILIQQDMPSDLLWSQTLDALLTREFPGQSIRLYGSRDSFIPHYVGHGALPVSEVIPFPTQHSGTSLRNGEALHVRDSEDFRAGAIYAATKRHPISFQTVDVAIVKKELDGTISLLMAGKKSDGGKLRFVGGFVDPKDPSLERAAKREAMEETSMIEIDDMQYLGSFRVADHRYHGGRDGVMTALFKAQFIFGAPHPNDDIDFLRWIRPEELEEVIVETHRVLAQTLLCSLNHNLKGEAP